MDNSPFIRMAPVQVGELPDHPSFQKTNTPESPRPDLRSFLLALLDGGNRFIENSYFNATFKHHSHRSAAPSKDGSDVLVHTVPTSTLERIDWKETGITGYQRSKPRSLQNENWFARRSFHENTSAKVDPSTASWEEFVYGLRDLHSQREREFLPTIYDARHVLDWNEEIKNHEAAWKLTPQGNGNSSEGEPSPSTYTNITLAVYEMCHALPWPLGPRCFAVLVATASTSSSRFIAVTIPVNLSSFAGAFYSNGRNRELGEDGQRRKAVTVGVYVSVESVELHRAGQDGGNNSVKNTKNAATGERIQWTMATASDAKGNLPMSVQKSSMPNEIPKDIIYFLKWIKDVDEQEIRKVDTGGPKT